MTKLIISTLGTLQITNGVNPLAGFLSDKVRALLVYLAVEQARPFRREALAALFWPEQPERRARANLRRALANLRQVIGDANENHLLISRQTLQFNATSSAIVDVIQFENLLGDNEPRLAQMEEAAALVNGRFLAGFSIRGSIAFEEWSLLKREHIQRRFLFHLNRLTTYYEEHQQPEKALPYAWQQVSVEPWYEPGQRQLMRLLAQTSRQTTALSHYEQFQKELAVELGVTPEPATRRLYDQIRIGRSGAKPQEIAPAFLTAPQVAAATPFVAREAELAQLSGYLQFVTSGQGHIVFISGETGSGKTALLQTFAQQAQNQIPEIIPLMGECQAHIGQGSPYLPFRSILSAAIGDIESQWQNGSLNRIQVNRVWSLRETAVQLLRAEAPDLLANLVDPILLPEADRAPAVTQPATKEVLFQQMTRFLQKFSKHGPLLILLDDLQWVDQGTIDLLFDLRRHLNGYPILIVGAYRPEEVRTNKPESGRRHPLALLMNEIRRDFGDIEVALNKADGRSFVDALLDSEPNHLDELFRETLYNQTQGQALFTVELVAGMKDRGELIIDQNGFWQAGENISWQHLPAKVEAIIAERIGRLPFSQGQLLKTGSIQGDTFASELVAQVLDRQPHEVIQILSGNLARTHRLLQVQGRQQIGLKTLSIYRFRHNLFQQYVYNRLDPIERTYLHQVTAEKLERFYETAEIDLLTVAAQLAYHFSAAQETAKAIHYHKLAGQHNLRLSADAAAADHFRQSMELLAAVPESEERIYQEIECLLSLGAAILATKGYAAPEVKDVYDRAYALCLKLDAKSEMVSSLFWLTSYYAVTGQLNEALVVAQKMLAISEHEKVDDLTKIQAHLLTGLPLFFMGCNEQALTHFAQACALYDPERHQPHVYNLGQDPGISAMVWQGHTLLHLGRMDSAKRCMQQAIDWADKLDHPYTSAFTKLNAGCTPELYFGRFDEGINYAKAIIAIAQENDFALMYAYGILFLGQMLVLANIDGADNASKMRVKEGFDLMYQGMDIEARTGAKLAITSHWVILAAAYLQTGQTAEAWQAVRKAEYEMNENNERYFEAELLRVKANLFQLNGNASQAEKCRRQALKVARQQKAKYWEEKLQTPPKAIISIL